jgi:hypothetical protein
MQLSRSSRRCAHISHLHRRFIHMPYAASVFTGGLEGIRPPKPFSFSDAEQQSRLASEKMKDLGGGFAAPAPPPDG